MQCRRSLSRSTLCRVDACMRGTAGIDERYARQWLQGAKWAAITIVNVGSPVLGKTSQACSPALELQTLLGPRAAEMRIKRETQTSATLFPYMQAHDVVCR